MEHENECGDSVTVGDANIRAGGDVNGVTVVKETIGVLFLGVVAVLLIVALQRAYARNQELWLRLLEQNRT